MVSVLVVAQIKFVVYKSDGSEIELLASEVDSIGFKGIDVKPDDSDEDELEIPIVRAPGEGKTTIVLYIPESECDEAEPYILGVLDGCGRWSNEPDRVMEPLGNGWWQVTVETLTSENATNFKFRMDDGVDGWMHEPIGSYELLEDAEDYLQVKADEQNNLLAIADCDNKVLYIKSGRWSSTPCRIIPAGYGKFVLTVENEVPNSAEIIFTGSFDENAWIYDSDRIMTKQADGTYVWEGYYPENFRFTTILIDNCNNETWMRISTGFSFYYILEPNAGSEIEFSGSFDVLCLDEEDEPEVVISTPSGYHNSYGYVDLGLPSGTLWATMNVGADSPEDYGDFFAWGETTTKSTYEWGNYKWCNGSEYSLTKYCTDSYYGIVDNKTELELVDDAAYINWGGDWRMPTSAEFQELIYKCTWKWQEYGYIVTGPNGNSIYIPAAGYHMGYSGLYCTYWSCSLSTYYSKNACSTNFSSYELDWQNGSLNGSGGRCDGLSVRPVMRQGSIFAVSLDNNGGEGAMQSIAVKKENQFTIPENEFTRSGYEFKGWNTKADGTGISYVKGDKITITSNITLYAQWISIYQETGISNGHGYVDLGLPSGTKWATMNVGATSPEDYGNYYAWGETETKSSYTLDNYKWYDVDNQRYTKYNVKTKQPSLEGYSILVNGTDFYEMTYEGFWGVDNSFVLYSLKGIPLRAGDTFVFHSNEDGNTWASAIVDEGGVSDIEGTGTEFNVISRGCYSIYLKLKFEEDHVYFGEGICGSNPTLDLTDDAAYVNWGFSWRIPTEEELDELRNTSYTTWIWTTLNGINGYKVTSKINGNSIFLPVPGYRYSSGLFETGSKGNYLSCSHGVYYSGYAVCLNFTPSNSGGTAYHPCYYGQSVRPVLSK